MENLNRIHEDYSEEIDICSSFYQQVLKPQIKRLEKEQYDFMDIIYKFLDEKGYDIDEFIGYLRLYWFPKYDLDFLHDFIELIEERKIKQEIMRDYYNSVLCPEDYLFKNI